MPLHRGAGHGGLKARLSPWFQDTTPRNLPIARKITKQTQKCRENRFTSSYQSETGGTFQPVVATRAVVQILQTNVPLRKMPLRVTKLPIRRVSSELQNATSLEIA